MDISFHTPQGRFNLRVCAVIVRDGKLLIMRDDICSYAYLPGGRVKLHETAESALLRELQEELHIQAKLLRALWFCQSFFTDAANGEYYHEICIYYLVDIEHTSLAASPERFSIPDNGHNHDFEWIPLDELKNIDLVPEFIKEEILHLPENPVMLTAYE